MKRTRDIPSIKNFVAAGINIKPIVTYPKMTLFAWIWEIPALASVPTSTNGEAYANTKLIIMSFGSTGLNHDFILVYQQKYGEMWKLKNHHKNNATFCFMLLLDASAIFLGPEIILRQKVDLLKGLMRMDNRDVVL